MPILTNEIIMLEKIECDAITIVSHNEYPVSTVGSGFCLYTVTREPQQLLLLQLLLHH